MEKIIATKVARLIELTGKFSKSVNEIFPDENNNYNGQNLHVIGSPTYGYINNTISISGNLVLNGKEIFVDTDGSVKSKDNKPLTRADEIRAKAEVKAKLSDEYDEYTKLRSELADYIRALKNVTE